MNVYLKGQWISLNRKINNECEALGLKVSASLFFEKDFPEDSTIELENVSLSFERVEAVSLVPKTMIDQWNISIVLDSHFDSDTGEPINHTEEVTTHNLNEAIAETIAMYVRYRVLRSLQQ